MAFCIVDTDNNIVDPKKLFGKDAKNLERACLKVMDNWLHYRGGCYRAPRPYAFELRNTLEVPEGSTFMSEVKKVWAAWNAEHPDEVEKEAASNKAWDEQREKQFRIVYGIAKRHHMHAEWLGQGSSVCLGDQWIISRGGNRIAYIYC